MMDSFATAARAFASGRPALFVNELRDVGIVGLPLETSTPDSANFLITECRGILYVGLPKARLTKLAIPPQQHSDNGPDHVHVPIDARLGVTTGISAEDRVRTIRALVDPASTPDHFRQPGHVVPMALHEGGVLGRPGLAEAVQAVAQANGPTAGVVFCAVLTPDGDMARMDALDEFGRAHDLPVVTLADTIRGVRRDRGWGSEVLHSLTLPYIGLRIEVRANGAGVARDRYPVGVVPACVPGHVLGRCECAGTDAHLRSALDAGRIGAFVATWPINGRASCRAAPEPRVSQALADLVAAHACAAVSDPWACSAQNVA